MKSGITSTILLKKNFTGNFFTNNEKYIRIRIKFSEGKFNTNFHDNKIPKEESQCISLSVILVDSVFRLGKNHHRQVF